MSAKTAIDHLRAYVHRTPWLFHAARSVRFTAMVGPLRPAFVGYHRRFNKNPRLAENPGTVFEDFDPESAAGHLDGHGYALGLKLPDDQVDSLVRHIGPRSHVVRFDVHKHCETANSVAHDPKLIDAARRYLKAEPVFYGTAMWWTIQEMGPQHAHRFHFDVADFKSVAAFIYLTDVDDDCGPHVVIGGTHERKTLAENARIYIDDATAEKKYGDRIRTITGPRGTGFMEEQTTYHKALPAKRTRLVFTVLYTLARKP